MKKYNQKQIAYAEKKSRAYANRIRRLLLFSVMALFMLPAIAEVIQNPTSDNFENVLLGGTGSVTIAGMALIGDVDEVSDKYSAANQIGYKVYLTAVEQIDGNAAQPTPNANREIGTLPLKTGEIMHYFDAIDNTLNDNSTGEKGEYTTDYTNIFGFAMAGNRNKLLDFIEEYGGRGFIIHYKECGGANYNQLGSYCKPMYLQSFDRKNNNEGKYITFNFQNKHWQQPLIYTGTIVRADPVTVAANETTIPYVSTNSRYKLTDNTAPTVIDAVSGLSSDYIGNTFTVYAGDAATNAATIPENSVFVLKGGTTWTANVGSEITFQIFDATTVVEISRVQT